MSALNPWHQGFVCAFDTETSGVDTSKDRIVTAAVLIIDPASKSIREQNWLLDPGVPIPDAAAKIHGVTTEHAQANGQDPATAILEITNALRHAWLAGWPVIGHNIGYDLSILDHELHRYGLGSVQSHGGPGMVIDTLALDKLIRPSWRGKRTLSACADAYGVRLDDAHQAKDDAVAAARLAWRMAEGWPTHVQLDLHELMDRQQRTHRAWAEEFGAYLRSQQKVDDVVRDWPYKPARPQAVPA